VLLRSALLLLLLLLLLQRSMPFELPVTAIFISQTWNFLLSFVF
jgi:hypothetical protein